MVDQYTTFHMPIGQAARQHDAALARSHYIGLLPYHPPRFPRNIPTYVFWHLLLVRSR